MAEVKGKERSTIVHVKVLIILSRMTKQLICMGIEATVIKKYREFFGTSHMVLTSLLWHSSLPISGRQNNGS